MANSLLKEKWITKTPSTRLYHLPVPIIGLTGGIATGKSTVAKLFRDKKIPVVDADQLVKKIYGTQIALDFIKKEFPSAIIYNPNNHLTINFKELRAEAFNSVAAKSKLEQFIYSHLPETFIEAYQDLGPHHFVVYDVPLLFEKELDKLVDLSLCVYSSRQIQKDRLMKRDHITEDLADKILAQQMDIEEKKAKSMMVLDNQGDRGVLEINFNKLLCELFA